MDESQTKSDTGFSFVDGGVCSFVFFFAFDRETRERATCSREVANTLDLLNIDDT